MNFNIAFVIILGVIIVYVALVNLYTILFQISGLTREKARFQVISLLTNAGYTTKESEAITSNKFRRRIAIAVMLTGNIFSILIVSLFVNLVFSFDSQQLADSFWIVIIAFAIFLVIVIILRLPGIRKAAQKLIEHISHKILKDKNRNVVTILDQYADDAVCEILVCGLPSILKDVSLSNSKISMKYGINVFSLQRGNRTIKVTGDTIFQNGDTILVFGNYQNIRDLFLNEHIVKPEEIVNDENVIDIIDNYHGEAMAKISINVVPEYLKNKTLLESPLRNDYNIVVLSIKRDSNIVMADKDSYINVDDELTVFGPYTMIRKAFLVKETNDLN